MKIFAACLVAGFVMVVGEVSPFPSAAQPTTPLDVPLSSVLQAYFAWRGGASFERLQSIHEKGAIEGLDDVTVEYWLDRLGRRRSETQYGGVVKPAAIATPDAAWAVNVSGQVEEDAVGSIKARRLALIEFGDALRGSGGAQVKLLGGVKRSLAATTGNSEERSWAVVGVTFGDADVYDLLIDPATGELGFFITEEGGQTSTYEFGDWRVVDGVRMPFRTILSGDVVNNDTHISQLELDRSFDQSLFSRPRSRGKISFSGSEKSSGWIKIDLVGGLVRLPVKVQGHQTTAVLDSGADFSLIMPQFAESAGLTALKSPVGLHGSGPSTETMRWVPGADLKIGEMTLHSLTLAAADVSSLAKGPTDSFSFILGNEAFAELVVDLDIPRQRLRFLDPGTFAKPSDAVEIPLLRIDGFRAIPVSIEGRKPVQLQLDLGANETLSLFPEYAQDERLLEGRKLSQSLFAGIGGIQAQTDVILRNLAFGGTSSAEVPASVLPQRVRGTYSNRMQGLMGTEILGRYRLIFDYPHNRLYALPDPKAIAAPYAKNRLGVSWLPDGDNILVMLVVPNSPAAEVGLKVGDKIAWIDGQPAKGWQSADARAALKEGPAGQKITFTLDNGESRTVTLSDYY